MGRFEVKIVGTMVLMAMGIFAVSVVLVRDMILVSTSMERQRAHELYEELKGATLFYRELVKTRKHLFHRKTKGYAEAIGALGEALQEDSPKLEGKLQEILLQDEHLGRLAVLDPSGEDVLSVSRTEAGKEDLWRVVSLVAPLPKRSRQAKGWQVKAGFLVSKSLDERFQRLGRLEMEAPHLKRLSQEMQPKYVPLFIRWFAISIVVVTFVGLLFARRITRRVTRLSAATAQVASGDLDVVVPVKSHDEIGRLAADFNKMVQQLENSREQIHYLQKISAWQEIARRLAHEIKNPLTPIRLAIQQVHDTYEGEDETFKKALQDAHEIIREEVDGLQQMVEEFSAFAKLPRADPQVESVDDILEEFAKTAGAAFGEGTVVCEIPGGGLSVRVDRLMFRRVLHNLAQNAVQACQGKGIEPRVEVQVVHKRKEGVVEWIVDDNGPGVEEDVLERIFDPYFTTKDTGTGLGLAIVKKILLEHRGSIQLDRSPTSGARFVIRLPASF